MSNLFLELFDLRTDQAEPEVIDETIRSNVRVAGTNLWVLFFAILVASVGLNVNSTAVIIGAMLISPLMGPIVGIGYGLGINDLDLIKLSLRNLAIFTFISVVASTLYFTISPLDTAQPELLSRTSPSMWDVLIAFFGGAAGIIATTRKSISNVVPGVAIATALMPPLCTAGFGIAHGNWLFFGGAFFLYCINGVFIALATLMFVKIFHLPKHHYMDEKLEKRTNFLIGLTVFLMIIPSVYLAYDLVVQSRFTQAVNQFVDASYKDNTYVLLGHETRPQSQEVLLTVAGSQDPDSLKNSLEQRLHNQGFDKAHVMLRYSMNQEVDLGSLKTELTQNLYQNLVNQVKELSRENQSLKTRLSESSQLLSDDQQLFDELIAQYPIIQSVTISRGERFEIAKTETENVDGIDSENTEPNNQASNDTATQATQVNHDQETNSETNQQHLNSPHSELIDNASPVNALKLLSLIQVGVNSGKTLTSEDKQRIENWLKVKYGKETIEVNYKVIDSIVNSETPLENEVATP